MKTEELNKVQLNQKVVDGLAHFLADSYILYLKTQNFHWNVQGPHFHYLHLMFEEQYKELADAVDKIAERMRALHSPAPASFAQFSKLTSLEEARGHLKAEDMLKQLLHDHEIVTTHGLALFAIAEQAGDYTTGDLILERLAAHEKTAWMLRSTLEN